jgi:hypothetical protein
MPLDIAKIDAIAKSAIELGAHFDNIINRKDATKQEFQEKTGRSGADLRHLAKLQYQPAAHKEFHHIINAPPEVKKSLGVRNYGSARWRESHPEWKSGGAENPIRKAPLP